LRGRRASGGDYTSEHGPNEEPRLADLGVTKAQSHSWQKFAALADEVKKGKIERAVKKAIAAVVPPPCALDQAAKGRSPSRICSGIGLLML
jgi:hypothetical protein